LPKIQVRTNTTAAATAIQKIKFKVALPNTKPVPGTSAAIVDSAVLRYENGKPRSVTVELVPRTPLIVSLLIKEAISNVVPSPIVANILFNMSTL